MQLLPDFRGKIQPFPCFVFGDHQYVVHFFFSTDMCIVYAPTQIMQARHARCKEFKTWHRVSFSPIWAHSPGRATVERVESVTQTFCHHARPHIPTHILLFFQIAGCENCSKLCAFHLIYHKYYLCMCLSSRWEFEVWRGKYCTW